MCNGFFKCYNTEHDTVIRTINKKFNEKNILASDRIEEGAIEALFKTEQLKFMLSSTIVLWSHNRLTL